MVEQQTGEVWYKVVNVPKSDYANTLTPFNNSLSKIRRETHKWNISIYKIGMYFTES